MWLGLGFIAYVYYGISLYRSVVSELIGPVNYNRSLSLVYYFAAAFLTLPCATSDCPHLHFCQLTDNCARYKFLYYYYFYDNDDYY